MIRCFRSMLALELESGWWWLLVTALHVGFSLIDIYKVMTAQIVFLICSTSP